MSNEIATPAITAAAHAAAVANAAVEQAQAVLSEKEAAAGKIRERVTELEAQRAGIVSAARSTGADAQAALRLEVLSADLAALRPHLAAAEAEVRNAMAAVEQARNAAARAETALQLEVDRAFEARLVAHASELDRLLVATLAELAAIRRRRGGRPAWGPTEELYREVTSLRLTAQRRAAA